MNYLCKKNEDNSITILNPINDIIKKNNFQINDNKIKFTDSKCNRQEVTGVIVNKKTNVKKEYYKSIRRDIHNLLINNN